MRKLNQIYITEDYIYEKVYQDQIGDDPNDIGYCDDKTRHIYIKLGLSKFDELDTTIHELLHAITYRNKIRISHNNIDKLATALARFLILNKLVK